MNLIVVMFGILHGGHVSAATDRRYAHAVFGARQMKQ
jgi:hypothetical protein